MTLSKEQKQTYRTKEQTCGCQGEGGWGKEGQELGISRCKLLYNEGVKIYPEKQDIHSTRLEEINLNP